MAHEHLLQSITGQLRKLTHSQGRQRQMTAHLFKKKSRKQIQALYLCQALILHSHARAFLKGAEYRMELPNSKSPCLNLAGSDVLHCFVTRVLQIPSIPCRCCYCRSAAQTSTQLSLKERIILCHFLSLYRAHCVIVCSLYPLSPGHCIT